jgi:hypothetical protein
MYFAQVAAEMAAHDLYFVGELPLYLNYRDLAVPESLAPVFAGVADRITFESLKDFAVNESFRRDVYVKGKPARADVATRDYLDTTFFGRLGEDGPFQRDVRLPHHTLHYAGPVFDALIPAIDRGASTVASLAARPELLGFGLPRVRDAVQRLLLSDQVTPMLAPTQARAREAGERLVIPSPYNRWVLHNGKSNEAPVVLASTATGNGIELAAVEAVAMVLLVDFSAEDRARRVSELCSGELRLAVKGRPVDSREERERVLLGEIERFSSKWLAKLLELGVLAVAVVLAVLLASPQLARAAPI